MRHGLKPSFLVGKGQLLGGHRARKSWEIRNGPRPSHGPLNLARAEYEYGKLSGTLTGTRNDKTSPA